MKGRREMYINIQIKKIKKDLLNKVFEIIATFSLGNSQDLVFVQRSSYVIVGPHLYLLFISHNVKDILSSISDSRYAAQFQRRYN